MIPLQVGGCASIDRQDENHTSSEHESLFLHQECLGKVRAKHNTDSCPGATNVQYHYMLLIVLECHLKCRKT